MSAKPYEIFRCVLKSPANKRAAAAMMSPINSYAAALGNK